VVKSISTRRLIGTLVVLVAVGGALPPPSRAAPTPPPPGKAGRPAPPPPALLRYRRDLPGDSKPILLDADEAVTWVAKGQRLVLLQGRVLVVQGTVTLRCNAAVAFVNLDRLQRTNILHVDIYGEQDVRLEDPAGARKGQRVLMDLNTRGELKLATHRKKIVQQPQPEAPLFRRATDQLATVLAPPLTPGPAPGRQEPAEVRPPRIAPPPPPARTPPMPAPPPPGVPAAPGGSVRNGSGTGTLDGGVVLVQYVPQQPPANPLPLGPRSAGEGAAQPVSPAVPPSPAPPAAGAAAPGGSGGISGLLTPPPAGGPSPMRQFSVVPRTGGGYQIKSEVLPNGEQATIITGGVIINVAAADGSSLIDIEADNAIVWSKGNLSNDLAQGRQPSGSDSRRDLEFYLSGNVVVLSKDPVGSRRLTAAEMYMDPNRNVAIALTARLEFSRKLFPQPIIVRANELRQVSQTRFKVLRAEVFSSKLPSDPGLEVLFSEATIDEIRQPRRGLFGVQLTDAAGRPLTETIHPVEGTNFRSELNGIPVWFLPYYRGYAEQPVGPLQSIRFGENRIFGADLGLSLNVFALFGARPYPGTNWRLDLDYLSRRGESVGTRFDYNEQSFFGIKAQVIGTVQGVFMTDKATDILGGGRGDPTSYPQDGHPNDRGRFFWQQNVQNLPEGFTLQTQGVYLSDRNFFEQYYKIQFDTDVNQSTFVYVRQQKDIWAWTGLVEPRLRNWVTEAQALPRFDGWLLGWSPWDVLTYNAHASAGYFNLRFTHDPPPGTFPPNFAYAANGDPTDPTDLSDPTVRLGLFQEVSAPFYVGPVKVAPYGLVDTTYYSRDEQGNSVGRVWGGGGVRASMPLTRLYPDVHSLLWNLDGLNHKIVLSADYRYVASNVPHTALPQIDRLNDDATDQALRDIRPQQLNINPGNAFFLNNSPFFDPQLVALRNLVDNRIDTLDGIEVLRLDARQRLQTKRGFPGQEHIVDWMVLDTSVSVFPAANRDNFGKPFSFAEYDYVWNIGDRTTLTSSGFYDPFEHGPREFTFGAYLNRPDRTNFFLGYRQLDPIESKAVTASVTYVFSPKYAATASSTYDFGTSQALANSLVFTRLGTDLNVSLGVTYNALQNNFGVLFTILPNLIPPNRAAGGLQSVSGPGGLLGGR
jgi:hypothetical protein